MSSAFKYSEWPPKLSQAQLDELGLKASSYALAHGLLYLPVNPPDGAPSDAIHAPIALFPSPFPKDVFLQAQSLQSIYNILYSRIALDIEFLDQVMGAEQGVGKVDEFTGQLWRGWKKLRDDGVHPVRPHINFDCSAW